MTRAIRKVFDARRHDDRGVVAGSDTLIFAVLAFGIGSLLIMNVWTVIDTTLAVSAAARESARAFAETGDDPATAGAAATTAANRTLAEYGKSGTPQVNVSGAYERCAFVTVTVEYDVALVSLPVFGDLGDRTATASHGTRIDAYRSGNFAGDCG